MDNEKQIFAILESVKDGEQNIVDAYKRLSLLFNVRGGVLPTDEFIEKYCEEQTTGAQTKPEGAGEIFMLKIGMKIGMKAMRKMLAKDLP